jgi:hypothetical protein
MRKPDPRFNPRLTPTPSVSPPIPGPIIGVVDGSDAAPGQVGEFMFAVGTFAYAAGGGANGVTSTGSINLINMPPGDWDFTISASFSDLVTSALFFLNPAVTGMSNRMFGLNGNFTMAGEAQTVVIIGQSARGSFAVNTSLVFEVQVFNSTATEPAGTMSLRIEARRRR